jgi:hypothetical protein
MSAMGVPFCSLPWQSPKEAEGNIGRRTIRQRVSRQDSSIRLGSPEGLTVQDWTMKRTASERNVVAVLQKGSCRRSAKR